MSLPPEALNMMCATCHEPLNVFAPESRPHVKVYVHGRRDADHEPVPVPRDASAVVMVCDFCNSPHDRPRWTHHTREVTQSQWAHGIVAKGREEFNRFAKDWMTRQQPGQITGRTVHHYSEGWAACDPCSTFIMRGEVSRLVTRSRDIARRYLVNPRVGRVATRRELLDQWDGFLRSVMPGREPVDNTNWKEQ